MKHYKDEENVCGNTTKIALEHSLGHFEELVSLWFPYTSYKLLKIPDQTASSTCQWVKKERFQ